MNHVTSRMIERASFDTTPFNRSKTKTVKMTKDEALSRILGIADHLQTRFAIPKFASEEILELKQIAESALVASPRNCDVLSKDEVIKVLNDLRFPKKTR